MPQNLDSGAKIGSATFVATSVGFGPQGGQGGGGIRTHDRWDPRAASLTIGPRGVISPGESSPQGNHPPGESSPRGIIPLGDTPLGNRPPGESSPWETPPWGIAPQGSPPWGITPWGIVPLGNLPLGNDFPGESPPWGIVPLGNRPIYVFVHGPILYFLPRPGWSRITSKS